MCIDKGSLKKYIKLKENLWAPKEMSVHQMQTLGNKEISCQ